jgi:hypothetical protein
VDRCGWEAETKEIMGGRTQAPRCRGDVAWEGDV